MDLSISPSMSELTLKMSAFEEFVDCCSKNAAANAEIILDDVFVIVVKFLLMSFFCVVCRLFLCTGRQRLLRELYERTVCLKVEWYFFADCI